MSSIGYTISGFIGGGFFFLLGSALVKLAFYIADEPRIPVSTRLCYLAVGLLAILCIFHGVHLMLGISPNER